MACAPHGLLNVTAAKLRNDLSRLSRKTWVTTKKLERLDAHLALYIAWRSPFPEETGSEHHNKMGQV